MLTQHQILPLIQVSIGPSILISGIGLILLSLNNRYIHVIDRSRALLESLNRNQEVGHLAHGGDQIRILLRRATFLRTSIAYNAISLLSAGSLIIVIFVAALAGFNAAWISAAVLFVSMMSFFISLIYFLRDLNLSLKALALDVSAHPDLLPPK